MIASAGEVTTTAAAIGDQWSQSPEKEENVKRPILTLCPLKRRDESVRRDPVAR